MGISQCHACSLQPENSDVNALSEDTFFQHRVEQYLGLSGS